VALVERMRAWGFLVLDCQSHTPHTERLGAVQWSRDDFLDLLGRALEAPTRCGPWPLVEPEPPSGVPGPGARGPSS